jgi:hypothetical protein
VSISVHTSFGDTLYHISSREDLANPTREDVDMLTTSGVFLQQHGELIHIVVS